MRITIKHLSIFSGLLLGSSTLQAADPNLKFSGTLQEPASCHIEDRNANGMYQVNTAFGRVPTNKLDKLGKSELRKEVQYEIVCDKKATGFALGITFTPGSLGTATGTTGVLATNIANLGILLEYGGQPVEFGKRYEVTGWDTEKTRGKGQPLYAAPVQFGDEKPKGDGEFEATATLEATYL